MPPGTGYFPEEPAHSYRPDPRNREGSAYDPRYWHLYNHISSEWAPSPPKPVRTSLPDAASHTSRFRRWLPMNMKDPYNSCLPLYFPGDPPPGRRRTVPDAPVRVLPPAQPLPWSHTVPLHRKTHRQWSWRRPSKDRSSSDP